MHENLKKIYQIGIVPVVKITDLDSAVPLARALGRGGIPVTESTFRTQYAADAIRYIKKEVPGILVGAGTVLTVEQVDEALDAGAEFIVTPGFNTAVVDHCLERGCLVLPGAPNTSDIERALERGIRVVKCFPAEAMGGLAYIKAVAGPYSDMMFMPTGGINAKNLNVYLSYDRVLACGGSWMVDTKKIETGDYAGITALCKDAVDTMLDLKVSGLTVEAPTVRQGTDESSFKKMFSKTGNFEIMFEALETSCKNGYLTVDCNNLDRAIFHLGLRGIKFDPVSKSKDSSGHDVIFLQDNICGLNIRLRAR